MSTPFKQLERLCLERKRTELHQGIRRLIKADPTSTYVLHRALDWYWRTGMNSEGLRLALPGPRRPISDIQSDPERMLWVAAFLTSLGAWLFAEKILKSVRPRTHRQKLLAGLTFAEIGLHDEALASLLPIADIREERRFFVHLALATVFQRQGDLNSGLKWNALALKHFTNDPDRWLFECFQAAFLADRGEIDRALAVFEAADTRYLEAKCLAPRYFAQTRGWKARILFQADRKGEAHDVFRLAEDHIRRVIPDYQPWRLLRLYDEMERSGGLAGKKRLEFMSYPARAAFWTKSVDASASPLGVIASLHVDLGKNEFRWNGQIHYDIPLEVRLIAETSRAGSIGVHRNLMKCLLWSEEIGLFFQLDPRLQKLRERALEEYGIRIETRSEVLEVHPSDGAKVSVCVSPDPIPSALIEAPETFSASLIGQYYGLSSRRGASLLVEWEQAGWVSRRGSKKGTRYFRAPS